MNKLVSAFAAAIVIGLAASAANAANEHYNDTIQRGPKNPPPAATLPACDAIYKAYAQNDVDLPGDDPGEPGDQGVASPVVGQLFGQTLGYCEDNGWVPPS